MKPRRFSILLAGCLLLVPLLAAGQTITIHFGRKARERESPTKALALALSQQMTAAKQRFDAGRQALTPQTGPDGKPAFVLEEVDGLIAHTQQDVARSIEQAGPELGALGAWATDEVRRVRRQLPAAPATTLKFSAVSAPRATLAIAAANLGGFPRPMLASTRAAAPRKTTPPKPKATPPRPKAAPPKPPTIATDKAGELLDQVGAVLSRILFLADHDDLVVKLWVGSTPASRAQFSFWSDGKIQKEDPESKIIQTNGVHEVMRGLYDYEARLPQGAVTHLIQFPNQAATQIASERLDLVNGTPFFCCRFNNDYCQHVADAKECRP
jgi:hypothetical protein